jgi:hypothetical protein
MLLFAGISELRSISLVDFAYNTKNSSTVSPASLMIAFKVPFGISIPR